MMHNSGYFFVGSKSAGFINTPSMVVPSVLFQEITSLVPNVKVAVCSVIFVSTRGEKLRTSETNTSLRDVGELAVKAIPCPSRVSENDPAMRLSGPETRVVLELAGSTRKRCEAVFCWAAK